MTDTIDILDLYSRLSDKLKLDLQPAQYQKVFSKLDKLIGLIYGQILGVMCGASNNNLDDEKITCVPVDKLSDLKDPVIGQIVAHINEVKASAWDAVKYKNASNYKSVICNASVIGVKPSVGLIEQTKSNKSPMLYNLHSEDFYTRIPMCALFGETSIDVVIAKIMQTHTSFDASAYGIIVICVLRTILVNEDVLNGQIDWSQILKNNLIPLLSEYYKIYSTTFLNEDTCKSEAEKLRMATTKIRLDESYANIMRDITLMTEDNKNADEIDEIDPIDSDSGSVDLRKLYQKSLSKLELKDMHISNPAFLAIWTVQTLQILSNKFDLDSLDPRDITRELLFVVSARQDLAPYNCMIVGSVLGSIFGFSNLPKELYSGIGPIPMDRLNRMILNMIASM